MRRLTLSFLLGFCAGWWRREDPFVKRYAYRPPRSIEPPQGHVKLP